MSGNMKRNLCVLSDVNREQIHGGRAVGIRDESGIFN